MQTQEIKLEEKNANANTHVPFIMYLLIRSFH